MSTCGLEWTWSPLLRNHFPSLVLACPIVHLQEQDHEHLPGSQHHQHPFREYHQLIFRLEEAGGREARPVKKLLRQEWDEMMVVLVVEELVVLQMVGVDPKVEQQHLVEEVSRPGR